MTRTLFVTGVVAVGLGSGVATAVLHPSLDAALIAAIALVCTFPIVQRMIGRRFDIFEPIVIANLALMVMYVGRPAAMLAESSQHVFKGYDITSHLQEALVLALAGAIAMQLGYASGLPRRAAARLPFASGRWDVPSTLAFSGGLIALALLLFGIFLHESGGLSTLANLLRGRSSGQDTLFRNSSAYLYAAPSLFWPASLLLSRSDSAKAARSRVRRLRTTDRARHFRGRPRLAHHVAAASARAGELLLPLTRPTAGNDLAPSVGYLVFTIGIAYFRETRTQGVPVDRVAELKHVVADPTYEYRQLIFHGADNDMFESLAAETIVVPARLKASPVDFVLRTLAKPIPSAIWSGKPLAPEEELTHALYPHEQVRASTSAGIIGSFFLAGELPGVVLGMLLVGWSFRLPWEYWRRFSAESGPQLFLAASLMFVPILLRGAVGDTLARALFGIVPLLLAVRLCRTSFPRTTPTALPAGESLRAAQR